jgi:hypothetical protein
VDFAEDVNLLTRLPILYRYISTFSRIISVILGDLLMK